MPKFFISRENITDNEILIDTEDFSHITRVLRLNVDDILDICDGQGFDYKAKIREIQQKHLLCDILSKEKSDTEPNIKVTLFQGLPKASKMEYIIQKTTELGITKIVPCVFSRCVVKLDNQKAEIKKVERWRKIAEEAAKQSGRGIVPEITMPVTFSKAMELMQENDLCFAPYECETQNNLKNVLTSKDDVKTVGFMIGPEGGYDIKEIDILKQSSIKTITLGRRILRTETAGEAVLSMVMYEIGDINNN